jgi:hypothetical protein
MPICNLQFGRKNEMLEINARNQTLGSRLCIAIAATAVIDLLVGLAFLLGPELGLTLWPTPISSALMRFIGAIILANGFGALMIVGRPTWENARTLFTVALVYGIAVLLGLLYQLVVVGAAPIFWFYVVVDVVFLVPIGAICWVYERTSTLRLTKPSAALDGGRL